MKYFFISALVLGLTAAGLLRAGEKPDLNDPKQKTSYALGLDIVTTFRKQEIEIDTRALAAGIADTLAGTTRLTTEEKKAAIMELFKGLAAKSEARRKILSMENLRAGQAFLAANTKKEGVKVLQAKAGDGSVCEMQYLILKSGSGSSPGSADVVEVHYEGSLVDGNIFDSSVQRSTPVTFGMNEVMAGWKAVLPMMKPGDKWRLFIPGPLAFGDSGPSQIGPNSLLIYDLDLLSFYTPDATPKPTVTAFSGAAK